MSSACGDGGVTDNKYRCGQRGSSASGLLLPALCTCCCRGHGRQPREAACRLRCTPKSRHTVVEQPPASDVFMDLSVTATRWARWTSCGTRCGTSTAASCRCGVPTFGTHMLTAPWHNKCPCEGSISTLVHKSGPRRPHDADVVRLAAHTAMHAFASAADLRQARLTLGCAPRPAVRADDLAAGAAAAPGGAPQHHRLPRQRGRAAHRRGAGARGRAALLLRRHAAGCVGAPLTGHPGM